MNGNRTVTATFTQDEYTLTIVSAHGTVTKTPDQLTYHYGDSVTLVATADAGWTFTGFSSPSPVTINGDTTIDCELRQDEDTLTLTTVGNGTVKEPDQATYHYGATVLLQRLQPIPAGHSQALPATSPGRP